MNLITQFLAFLTGCVHSNLSFPQSRRGQTTVSCLKCGKEFLYDWNEMRITAPLKPQGHLQELRGA